jgi:hypothetical protein
MHKRVGLLAAALLLLLAGSVAYASIPDSQGVIHACRKNNGGALRVIDTDARQTCTSNETALDWSQTGPQGPAGSAGPAGPAGPQGPEGPPGPAGTGATGYEIIGSTLTVQVDAGQTNHGDFIDTCASRNKRPVGGGGFFALLGDPSETPNPAPGWSVGASYPFRNAEGSTEAWAINLVRAPGGPAATYELRLWVACLTATS